MVIRDEDYGEEDPDMLEEVLTGRLNRFETDADPLDFGPDEYISQYIAQPEIVKNDCNKAEVADILDQEPGLPPNLVRITREDGQIFLLISSHTH